MRDSGYAFYEITALVITGNDMILCTMTSSPVVAETEPAHADRWGKL